MTDLEKLAIKNLTRLGQEAFSIHQELERWRAEPMVDIERTKLSLKLQYALEEQQCWINALLKDNDEEN